MILWLYALAAAAEAAGPEVLSEQVDAGKLAERLVSGDGAELVLAAVGEQDGQLGTCGCGGAYGSLARAVAYVAGGRAADPAVPWLLLDPGGWLPSGYADADPPLRPDAIAVGRVVSDAVAAAEFAAVNVGFRDLPWLAAYGFPENAVSANVRATTGAGPATHVVVTAGGTRVAITGVSGEGMRHQQPERFAYGEPVAALTALVPTLEADLVVVLAYAVPDQVDAIARLPGVDVVIEANEYAEPWPATAAGAAVWTRTVFEGQRLEELRLDLDAGAVVHAVDRSIALDDRLPSDKAQLRFEKAAAAAIAPSRSP